MKDKDWFPNGLPRYVTWYTERDGIKYVIGQDGSEMPVLDDHWIVCDTKKVYVVNYYYPTQKWSYDPLAPVVVDMMSSYHSNEEDALDDAMDDQARLEEEGRFIPICHRF
jgi:hypothetical protein